MTLPDKAALLDWIRANPDLASKRDVARAFGLKGPQRVELKRMLRELVDEGHVEGKPRRFAPAGHLPPVTVLVGDALDEFGELTARPQSWKGEGEPPPILVVPRRGDPALGAGDRFLAKLHPVHEDGALRYEARLIRKLQAGAKRSLGVFRLTDGGGRVLPVDKSGEAMRVDPRDVGEAKDGELVEVEAVGSPRMGMRRVRVVDVLGDPSAPKAISLIAIHEHGLPVAFPDAVLEEADRAEPPSAAGREDLRDLDLLTIDPSDARDHDDAVCALEDGDGWRVWVAIADVAHYVRPGSALDREARRRGNSAYFPDRVVPMLPEGLSGDLCSLHENEDRPVIAVELRLSADGRLTGHRFVRGVMRSRASLAYETAQAIADGAEHAVAEPVRRLFAAWRAAHSERERRAPLDLDLPERRVVLDENGTVTAVTVRERLDAHRVIEEFMILANVAAAETLEAKKPLLYRVHEEPNPEKLDALREQMETLGLTLAKGQVLKTAHLNRLLAQAADSEFMEMVNMAVLRAQTQAYYSPENFGHFGLALRAYAHFTSPIRRYADLIVHRALVSAHGWGPDGLSAEEEARLQETAEHVSRTERRAMEAERDTVDRYLAAWLAEREGATFPGRVSGVQKFGLFVTLDEAGASGLVPVGTLGAEWWRHDPDTQTLTGERSGTVIGLGARVQVRLVEVAPVAGGLRFELLEVEDAGFATASARRRSAGPPKRKLGKARIDAAKQRRKRRRERAAR